MLPRISRSFLLSTLMLSLAATTALFAASPSQAQTKGGTLTYSTVAGPASLDPYMAGSLIELEVIHEIFETLVAMDENYNARPMLASKVDISNEAKTFTFTLRKGVKFSNGQEMTSADVLASFERFTKVSTNARAAGRRRQIRNAGPVYVHRPSQEHQRRLHRPAQELDLSAGGAAGEPEGQAGARGRDHRDRAVQTRRMAEGQSSRPAAQRELHAGRDGNDADGFAGKKTVYLDSVRYNFIPEANARLAALQTKKSDIIGDLTLDLAKRLDGNAELSTLKTFPYCQQYFVLHSTTA